MNTLTIQDFSDLQKAKELLDSWSDEVDKEFDLILDKLGETL